MIAEEGAEPDEPGDRADDRGDREAVRRRGRRDERRADRDGRRRDARGRRRDVGGERGELGAEPRGVRGLDALLELLRVEPALHRGRPQPLDGLLPVGVGGAQLHPPSVVARDTLTAPVRLPFLLVPFPLLLALAPAAAAAPVRTLSVAPERALSVTLTLPAKKGKVRLENGPRKLTIKVAEDGDDLFVRGVDLGRNRLPRAARLIVSNHDGITSVTLGPGVVAQTASRTVRLRGVARLTDRYASSVADPVDRLAQRAGMLHLARPRTQSYLGQGLDGALHYRELRNWTAAFLPGLLWQVAAARDSALHARWAMEEIRDLRARRGLRRPRHRLRLLARGPARVRPRVRDARPAPRALREVVRGAPEPHPPGRGPPRGPLAQQRRAA